MINTRSGPRDTNPLKEGRSQVGDQGAETQRRSEELSYYRIFI